MDHLLTEGYTVHVHHFFEMAKNNDVLISERRECALISIDQIADLGHYPIIILFYAAVPLKALTMN